MVLHRFKSKLEGIGPGEAWVKLEVPLDVPKLFKTKARISVKGTLNGFAFRTSMFPNGDGTFHIMVNKAMRAGAKAGPGDAVAVTLERDDGPREVDVPVELAKALKKEGLAKVLEALTPSCRQEYATWIADAKAEETRERRIAKALPMIAERKRLKG